MSRDFQHYQWSKSGGSTLISEVDDRYRPRTPTDKRPNRVGHNLNNIQTVLRNFTGPIGTSYASWDAFDVFAGYLLFDAWIANTDRHEDNWAVLKHPDGQQCLAPSFDHGSALGSGLEDVKRSHLLVSDSVGSWCGGGRAHRFEDMHSLTLLEFARRGLSRASPAAREHWLDRLGDEVVMQQCREIVAAVPGLSPVASTTVPFILILSACLR